MGSNHPILTVEGQIHVALLIAQHFSLVKQFYLKAMSNKFLKAAAQILQGCQDRWWWQDWCVT